MGLEDKEDLEELSRKAFEVIKIEELKKIKDKVGEISHARDLSNYSIEELCMAIGYYQFRISFDNYMMERVQEKIDKINLRRKEDETKK